MAIAMKMLYKKKKRIIEETNQNEVAHSNISLNYFLL